MGGTPNARARLRPNQIRGASLDLPNCGRDVEVIYGDHGEIKSMPWSEWRYACAESSEVDVLRAALGDALMHVRLALVAAALVADGFSDDDSEVARILSLLCERLVAAGAVDPMEAESVSAEEPTP